jgi:predicted Zn-dependent protease
MAKTMARYGLSQLELTQKNHKAAAEYLNQVMADLPDKKILLTDKGVMLYLAGSYEQAKNTLELAGRNDPKDMLASFYLAKTYLVIGDMAQAESLFSTVSYNMPEYSKVYFELGQIAAKNKDRVNAALFLGKYYLYEGKLESARFSLEGVVRDKKATDKQVEEGKLLLDTIERLED